MLLALVVSGTPGGNDTFITARREIIKEVLSRMLAIGASRAPMRRLAPVDM